MSACLCFLDHGMIFCSELSWAARALLTNTVPPLSSSILSFSCVPIPSKGGVADASQRARPPPVELYSSASGVSPLCDFRVPRETVRRLDEQPGTGLCLDFFHFT